MPLEFLISALVTMLVVVDPIGLVPSYLAITQGLPPRARRSVALHATLIAAAILIGSALVGDWLLRTLYCRPSVLPADCCCFRSPPKWCSACAPSVNRSRPSRRSKSTCATSQLSRWPF